MSSDHVLEEIRSRIDIVEIVSEHVPLKKAGRNWKGLCPFHPEKTPSFTVNAEKQIFHCFGCGAGGDVFAFAMRRDNLTFQEAKEHLARRAGVKLAPGRAGAQQGEREGASAALAEALAFYKESLANSQTAQQYIAKRGLTPESVERFGIGYSPEGWHGLTARLKQKGIKEAAALAAGLAVQGPRGAYDIFRGRLMFPIRSVRGEAVAFGGRILDSGEPKYLNSPDTPLFKKRETLYALDLAKDEISKRGFSIVVEGYLDVIVCHQFGLTSAVAPLGTALTHEHLRRLARYSRDVVLIFDGDRAGMNAARRSLALILEDGMRGRALALPDGEDPDSILRARGADHFMGLMKDTLSAVGFALGRQDLSRTDAVRDALELISHAEDPLMRDELLAELADKTSTQELTLREALRRMKNQGGHVAASGRQAQSEAAKPAPREETMLLSLALADPSQQAKVLEALDIRLLLDPVVRGVFSKLAEGAGRIDSGALTEQESALVSRLSVMPGFDAEEAGVLDQMREDCVGKIRKRQVTEEFSRTNRDLRSAEQARDEERIRLLTERQKKLISGAK